MKMITLARHSAFACTLIAATQAQASLLADGEFDLATSGTLTSGSAWSLIANMPDGASAAAQFQTGFANANNSSVGGTQAPGVGTGLWLRSFEGNQGNSGEALAQAVLTQSVFAPANGSYTLDFVAGRETNFNARVFGVTLSTGNQSSTVDLLTAVIPDGNLGGAASSNPGGTPFSITLNGVTAGELLTVTAVMIDGADAQIPGGQSAFLDDFVLIPEPASLALMGLGGLAILRRRN